MSCDMTPRDFVTRDSDVLSWWDGVDISIDQSANQAI